MDAETQIDWFDLACCRLAEAAYDINPGMCDHFDITVDALFEIAALMPRPVAQLAFGNEEVATWAAYAIASDAIIGGFEDRAIQIDQMVRGTPHGCC